MQIYHSLRETIFSKARPPMLTAQGPDPNSKSCSQRTVLVVHG